MSAPSATEPAGTLLSLVALGPARVAACGPATDASCLVNRAARLSEPECRFLPTARVLASSVRVRPSLLVQPQAWRLLTTRALGRRPVGLLRGI